MDIEAQAHFHFYPDCKVEVNLLKNEVKIDNITITFNGSDRLEKKVYTFAHGYNNKLQADKITVTFRNTLETKIKVKS